MRTAQPDAQSRVRGGRSRVMDAIVLAALLVAGCGKAPPPQQIDRNAAPPPPEAAAHALTLPEWAGGELPVPAVGTPTLESRPFPATATEGPVLPQPGDSVPAGGNSSPGLEFPPPAGESGDAERASSVPRPVGPPFEDVPAPPSKSFPAKTRVSRSLTATSPFRETPPGEEVAAVERLTSAPHEGFSRELVYYATDRNCTGRKTAREWFGVDRGSLQFGVCAVSIPYRHKPGELESKHWTEWSEDPRKHILLLDPLEELSEAAWMNAVRQKLAGATSREILVFVHGYNVQFEHAIRRTAQLSYDLNFPGAAVCFSWPSGNNLVYTRDWTNAEWCLPHCVQVLKQLSLFARADRIHIVAHSMGSRVVTLSLKDLSQSVPMLDGRPLFNQVVLAAPDLDAEIFQTQIAPAIRRSAQHLTIYAAEQDLALKLSRQLNGHDRLGTIVPISQSRSEDQSTTLEDWMECVDATHIAGEALLSFKHAYYGDSPRMISDLRNVLAGQTATARGLICEKPGVFQIR